MSISLLQFCGLHEDFNCGYCKNEEKATLGAEKSVSLGVWAHELTPPAYLTLLDCGWRRSGDYVYKPIMERTCCPQYTIRLDATRFDLSKSQKRVMKRMNDYLKYDIKPKSGPIREEASANQIVRDSSKIPKNIEKPMHSAEKKSKGDIVKKKIMRRERCIKKWQEKKLDVKLMQQLRREKEASRKSTLISLLPPYDPTWKHRLEVVLVRPKTELELSRREECYELFKTYQATVHNDTNCSLGSYDRFLLKTPLQEDSLEIPVNQEEPVYGSYHQWYILDGKIIAVGAVDILPHCLSSKYVFYDPEFSFLNLGTYTALREILYTQLLASNRRDLKYYYMGYYIQNCPKMRYKGTYRPSELLCDQSFKWFPLAECVEKILANNGKYIPFGNTLADRMQPSELNIWLKGTMATFGRIRNVLIRKNSPFVHDISMKVHAVSSRLSRECSNLVFYFDEICKALLQASQT